MVLRATKGVIGAMPAIVPGLYMILKRGSVDPELNTHAIHILNAIRLLVCTHSQMRLDRKLSVTKMVHSKLRKELIKEKRDLYGDVPQPDKLLLGENLAERNR